MKKKTTTWIIAAVAAVLLLVGAGVLIAVTDPFDLSDDDKLSGETLERASTAALDAVGSGTVTDAEASDDPDHAYDVEVTLDNGEDVNVLLDESFSVVRIEGDTGGTVTPCPEDTITQCPQDTATPGPDDTTPVSEAERAAASAAALAALEPGTTGTVTEVERSDDADHAYDVEVTLSTGEDIDMDLDENFAVLTVEGVPAG